MEYIYLITFPVFAEAYLAPFQTSKIELFAETVNEICDVFQRSLASFWIWLCFVSYDINSKDVVLTDPH